MNRLSLLGTTLGAALLLAVPHGHGVVFGGSAALADDSTALRPAVGNPLSKAKSLMAAHSYGAASAQVNIADKQKNKSAYESFVIQEMRGAIAQASGDTATASRVYQSLINSGRIGGAQLTQMLEAETSLSYQSKDYPGTLSWAERYFKSGGKDPAIHTLVIQAYYLQNDYANAAVAQKAQIDEELKARKIPPEDQLQLLAACQKQIKDGAGLTITMTQLITYYPKPSYWADVIYALQTKPSFSDRLELDLDLFKLSVGAPATENDFMQMAQLAMGENNAPGGAAIIAEAQRRKVFGPGPQADREARLTALVDKASRETVSKLDANLQEIRSSPASTSQQLYEVGQDYASSGQFDKGTALMSEAIARGDLRRPALAQLRVGENLVSQGNKAAATAAFQKVPDTDDGTSDLAKLWLLWLHTQPTLQPSLPAATSP